MQNLDDCREVVRQLWPYLDGALPDEWQERVTAHLAQCDNCRSHYDWERKFLEVVRETQAVEGDFDALRQRVLDQLAAAGFGS